MRWSIVFALALVAAAQEPKIAISTTAGGGELRTFSMSTGAGMRSFAFEYEGKTVMGAPYSAQAVTESTQVLADGNRITHKASSSIARDSMGRTRREETLNFVGPWTVDGQPSPIVTINDPVAGVRYHVETGSKTAVKMTTQPGLDAVRSQKLEAELRELRARRDQENAARTKVQLDDSNPNTVQTESLGSKVIEGVQADGKRVTETIPAGKIGNDKPIQIVNETWFSSELQTVVMSKHSDPRSGDVTYTLTNISRAEPDPSLFQVPAGYQMKSEGAGQMRLMIDREFD